MFKHPTAKDTHAPTPEPAPAPETRPPAAPAASTAPLPTSMSPTRRQGESAASIIAPDMLIKGGIEGRGEIQLQGRAWGDVKVERLMVGDSAQLEGSVEAVVVEIRGRVVGSISARQVRLLPSAHVEGDITYEQLSIEIGAYFEGRCIKSKGVGENAALPAPTFQAKGERGASKANGAEPAPAPAPSPEPEPAAG